MNLRGNSVTALAEGVRLGEHPPNEICRPTRTPAEYLVTVKNSAPTSPSSSSLSTLGGVGGGVRAAQVRPDRAVDGASTAISDRPMPRGKRWLWTKTARSTGKVAAAPRAAATARTRAAGARRREPMKIVARHLANLEIATTSTTAPTAETGAWPLVMLGPGADYTRRYIANGAQLECVRGDAEVTSTPVSTDDFLSEDILHNRFLSPVARAWRTALGRFQSIAIEIFSTESVTAGDESTPLLTINDREHHHEPDTEATPRPQAGRPMAAHEGVLADHARARRSPGRQQGDGVRARRGAHREGGAGQGCEQGSLFDAVA
jgi:hypothetical protein